MTGRELRQLEKDLQHDLVDRDEAVLSRLREGVKQFLLHEASRLVDRNVKDEEQILDLLQLYTRVSLLKTMVEHPKSFNIKDQKELYKSIGEEKRTIGPGESVDLIEEISKMRLSPEQKALVASGTLDKIKEVVKERMRGELGK